MEEGPKHVPAKKLDQNVEADPLRQVSSEHQLGGAKNFGNKFELLEALLIEGKLTRRPYAGPQAIKSEAQLTTGEIVTEAVVAGHTAGTEVAQTLTQGQRHDLMKRVLEERPTLSMRELRATCEMLDIDPKPFVDHMLGAKVEKLQENIQQATRTRNISIIILAFSYESREDLQVVIEKYQQNSGTSVAKQLEELLKSPEEKLKYDLSLFGRAETPLEDLQRIQAVLMFERAEREKNGVFFIKPDHIHLSSAEEKLREAASLLDKDELASEDDYDSFQTLLGEAKDALDQYHKNLSRYERDPAAYLALLLAFCCITAIVYLSTTAKTPAAVLSAISVGATLWYRHTIRQKNPPRHHVSPLMERFLTDTQRRLMEKSSALKRRII